MKRIIIIDHEPLTLRREQIFHMEEFLAAGFELEHWDMSQYFFPGMTLPNTLQKPYGYSLNSLEELEERLREQPLDQTLFIVEFFNRWCNRKVFRLLNQYGCFTVKLELYSTATLDELPFWQKVSLSSPKQIANGIFHRIEEAAYRLYQFQHHFNPYQYAIRSGCKFPADLYINHPDWEQYMTIKDETSKPQKPYAVFLDEYFPLHPDLRYFLGQDGSGAVEYQHSMNRFFEQVEQRYGVEVVIAAHPKSDYNEQTFQGRRIIKYQTAKLVRDSSMALMHSSAAFSFVVMFDKPLTLLTTQGYHRAKHQYQHLQRLSRMSGLGIVDVDGTVKWSSVGCRVPSSVRERYIYEYLTVPGIEHLTTRDILQAAFSELTYASRIGKP
ncbi:hypothetical protein [Millionella massiliensis]|uniref:hypothetical protein n=1 Tax=Millionella massiliensis TaxID=1871023 RepID=UPI0008D9D7BB|nr:hypothetical protein [Millionella massiliensis]